MVTIVRFKAADRGAHACMCNGSMPKAMADLPTSHASLQQQSKRQQYMADLSALASSMPPCPQHRPRLALSKWQLALKTQSPQGRCERLCPSSTMAGHAPNLDGLQSCCGMLVKRSQWRMARSASCTCWRPSWLPCSTVHSRVAHSQLQSSLPSSCRSSKREINLPPAIIVP